MLYKDVALIQLIFCLVIANAEFVSDLNAFTEVKCDDTSKKPTQLDDSEKGPNIRLKRDASGDESPNSKIAEIIQNATNFILEGEEHMQYSDSDDAVIVLGISGSGKSTLLQVLTTDANHLYSEQVGLSYIIKENITNIGAKVKIGHTTQSHTLIPELLIDESGITYYDCPGFGDTRDEVHDIAAGYYIKRMFESTTNIKLVFTISFPKMLTGVDRSGFVTLLRHATQLIKNINSYNESISLIVTKVDAVTKRVQGKFVSVADFDKINAMVDFMKSVKNDLSSDSIANKGMIDLIDIFCEKDGSYYPRIGLFNRPLDEGVLSTVEGFQFEKSKLLSMIHDYLEYSPKSDDDIKISLAPSSKLFLTNISIVILNSVDKTFNLIKDETEQLLLQKMKDSKSIDSIKNELLRNKNVVSNLFFETQRSSIESQRFFDYFKEAMSKLALFSETVDQKFSYVKKSLNFLKFSENLSQEKIDLNSEKILNPFKVLMIKINKVTEWYEFLGQFSIYLASFEVQHQILLHKAHWKNLEIKSIEEYFDDNPIFNSGPSIYNELSSSNSVLGTFITKQLKDIVKSYTFDPHYKIELLDDQIKIEGTIIILSNLINELISTRDFQNKDIFICAYDKIFLNSDLNIYNSKSLTIISPTWEITEKVTIHMMGADAMELTVPKAKNGTDGSGLAGSNGAHGNDGLKAGNFIAVADIVINLNDLHIKSSGGRGGKGQDGGNGGNGKDGSQPRRSIFEFKNSGDMSICYGYYQKKKESPYLYCSERSYENKKLILVVGNSIDYHYNCYLKGDDAGSGGNAGNGGNSGRGGQPGNIFLHTYGNMGTNISTERQLGASGTVGHPGNRGEAGRKFSQDVTQVENNGITLYPPFYIFHYCYKLQTNIDESRDSGKSGRSGRNGEVITYNNVDQNVDSNAVIKNLNIYQRYSMNIPISYGRYAKLKDFTNKIFQSTYLTNRMNGKKLYFSNQSK